MIKFEKSYVKKLSVLVKHVVIFERNHGRGVCSTIVMFDFRLVYIKVRLGWVGLGMVW